MAVSKRPKRETKPKEEEKISQDLIEAVISKGGSVAGDETLDLSNEDPLKNVQLRLYQSMINEIDQNRAKVKRGKVPSRHAWIVEAIEEKLKRENS